ncbi:DUF2326 domain-containing protein [Methylobacterium organophilum]|uniref:ABC-three component system protein n=1 Tax=Methylobacterium organophilum TaxID=410 RepID=UPI001F142DC0|nr:ABC-three component system protein [Methylobacterium organophilum]UMY19110.1 DUF2326 domain-containing protein [Methylobacterium organophilum]
MILSIESDLPTFKSVRFHDGLNVLLSDRAPESGDKQTRNSAGKSSLVEVVNFLLGSKAGKESLLRHPKLKEYTFEGTFRLGDEPVTVRRSGNEPARILIDPSQAERLGMAARKDRDTGDTYVSNEVWKEALGHWMFGLPAKLKGSAYEEPFTPSFRSMLSYFVRRNPGGFISPFKHYENQFVWDWQVNLSYLLGLDWTVPSELQRVREKERQLEELKKVAKGGGALGEVIGTVAELRPKLVLAEAKAEKLRTDLANFKVVDSYREMSDRAAEARNEMLRIERRATSIKENLAYLRTALERERAPETGDVERVYAAIGIELPDMARRRFDAVNLFHRSVVENRRTHLQAEIAEFERELADGEAKTSALDASRQEILRFLDGGGAFEDFLLLQKELATLEAEAASLRQRFQAAELLEGQSTQLEIDRSSLRLRLQADHQARKTRLNEAILFIGKVISTLYADRSGEFVVEAADTGPNFRITIQGDRGGGISSIEIFCLDLALLFFTSRERRGPRFLIHDSHIFDGVDERQIALALNLGGQVANSVRSQYIVTMNSDIFDRLPLAESHKRDDIVLPVRLADLDEKSGLFGFRFD